jgi:hypothetical protein
MKSIVLEQLCIDLKQPQVKSSKGDASYVSYVPMLKVNNVFLKVDYCFYLSNEPFIAMLFFFYF